MRAPIVHWGCERWGGGEIWIWVRCGRAAESVEWISDTARVTCKRCLSLLPKAPNTSPQAGRAGTEGGAAR
jgi:hypothetical protein